MPFNGNGTFNLVAGNPVTSGTTILSTVNNNTNSDIASGLSNCVTRDGQSPATTNLPMGGFKLTGLAAGSIAGDSLRYEQLYPTTPSLGSLVYGTGTAIAYTSVGNAGEFLISDGASSPQWLDLYSANSTFTGSNTFSGANTFTGKQTLSGSSSNVAAVLSNAAEKVTVSATAATGTINYDVTTQSVLYYTTAASANWTMNFRASSGTTLNAALAIGESITVTFLATNGATAYYNNAITIDGTSVTPKYQGGVAWSYGTASGIDVYTYTIIKTASATFTVLASQVRFA